ncbi:MAG TPA: CoA pyrophosphatase [Rhodocyclaceae bacterium]|nr:CoA pyrophosphatase [Rhodocyclaceae bacterium]
MYPPSGPVSITPEWLRRQFALGSIESARSVQHLRNDMAISTRALTPAAVLIPLVLREDGMTVLLTERAKHLKDHAGQVSFPGGRCEPEDLSPIHAAIREANEEVGLLPQQIEVIGSLPVYDTGTGFEVVPVLALVQPPLEIALDDFEVDSVFEVPLSFVFDQANHQRHRIEARGQLRDFWALTWDGHYIWGATAAMLVSLYHFLFASMVEPAAKP